MALNLSGIPSRDMLVHLIDKAPGNYFDEEVNMYIDGGLPGGGVLQSYVDDQDAKTLAFAKSYTDAEIAKIPSAKLYTTTGQNTDGAVTQKLFSDSLSTLNTSIDNLGVKLNNSVQFDTTVDSNTSTVTITKTVGPLGGSGTGTEMALPVASDTQAGVMNSATYKTVQENAELVQSILHSAVAVKGLPASPTQEELTAAWKAATSETELINRASIFDIDNNKVWYYYGNISAWQATSSDGSQVTINQATNDSLGIVKGSTEKGQASVETDGTLSLNGWDDLVSKVENSETQTTNLPTQVVYNTSLPEYKESEVDLTLVVKDLHTGGDASLPLNIMGATTTTAGVMTSAQAEALENATTSISNLETSVDGKQDTLVSGTNIKTINGESLLGEGNIEISADVDLSDYITTTDLENALDNKQDTLIGSGEGQNIKTINGQTLLGTGDIEIETPALNFVTLQEFNTLWENA